MEIKNREIIRKYAGYVRYVIHFSLLATLALSAYAQQAMLDGEDARLIIEMMFLCMIITRLVELRQVKDDKLLKIKMIIDIVLYAGCILSVIYQGISLIEQSLASWLYAASLIISRVISILRHKTVRHTLMNLMAILSILFVDGVFLVFLIWIMLFSLYSAVRLSFSHIKIDILKKIIRKTYAAEVLMGLSVLMTATSIILPSVETGIPGFADALWYCFSIVTTIGFGDYYATSLIGRILTVLLGIYGIIVVALITSIIVNFYGEVKFDEEEDE